MGKLNSSKSDTPNLNDTRNLDTVWNEAAPKTIAVKLSQRPMIGADDPRVVVTRYVENADGSLQTQCLDTHGVWQNRPEGFEYEEFDGFHMDRPTYSNGGVE